MTGRRTSHEWEILIAVVAQLVFVIYSYGKLNQKVDDLAADIARVEMQLVQHMKK